LERKILLKHCSRFEWGEVKDWAAIEDVVPGMERALWFLTIVSIFLNIAPILLVKKARNNY